MTAPITEKSTTDLHGPNLILDVENFGPIAEAKNIEFKPMTVFVGPSNTGKTYLAILLHSLLKARRETWPRMSFTGSGAKDFFATLIDSDLETLKREIRQRVANPDGILELEHDLAIYKIPVSELSDSSRKLLTSIVRQYLMDYVKEASNSVNSHFGVSESTDLSRRFNDRDSKLRIDLQNEAGTVDVSFDRWSVDSFDLPPNLDIYIDLLESRRRSPFTGTGLEMPLDLETELNLYARSILLHFPFSHYFEAGRTGLMDSYRELAASLINRAVYRSRLERSADQLSVRLTTNEFLQALVRLRSIARPAIGGPVMERLASGLETGVLGGNIHVVETAGITHFEYENTLSGVTVDIDRAASMVTEVAPIVMFLRQGIDEGDLVIIDEPEAHLHPEAQQHMAAALAFMVRSGLRVLITTHSHYMVEQLSAFVNASKLDETTRKRALSLGGALGEEDIYLNEDETAVYSFRMSPEHGGSVVEEIFMGEEFEYGPHDHSTAVTHQLQPIATRFGSPGKDRIWRFGLIVCISGLTDRRCIVQSDSYRARRVATSILNSIPEDSVAIFDIDALLLHQDDRAQSVDGQDRRLRPRHFRTAIWRTNPCC